MGESHTVIIWLTSPFPDRGAKRLIRATTAYAALRSPAERSNAGSRSLYKCKAPPFSQSNSRQSKAANEGIPGSVH